MYLSYLTPTQTFTLTQNTFPTTPHLTESHFAEAVWKHGCKSFDKSSVEKRGSMSSPLGSGRASDCLCLTIETEEVKPCDFWGRVTKSRAASMFPRTLTLGTVKKTKFNWVHCKDPTGFLQWFMNQWAFHLADRKELQGAVQSERLVGRRAQEQGNYKRPRSRLVIARLLSFRGL